MKCQKCSKPATYNITDIERGNPREYHFCDEHARQHINPPEETPALPMGDLAADLIKGHSSSREPSPADKQACPVCQITFLEFRNSGRLGCPHDYEVFRNELMSSSIGGVNNPISRLTVACLIDQGYEVDLDAAEPYTFPMPVEGAALTARRLDGHFERPARETVGEPV